MWKPQQYSNVIKGKATIWREWKVEGDDTLSGCWYDNVGRWVGFLM